MRIDYIGPLKDIKTIFDRFKVTSSFPAVTFVRE